MTDATGITMRIGNILKKAWHSQTVENTFWVGAASAMSALLGAVTSGLYARTLGVNEYGVLSLIISIMTVMIAFSDLGIGGSIVRFGSEMIARGDGEGFRSVLTVALKAKLALSAIVIAAAVIFLKPIVAIVFTHVDSSITVYFLMSLVAAAFGMLAALFPPIFQSHRHFRTLAAVTISQPLLKVAVLVVYLYGFVVTSLRVQDALWIEIGTGAGFLLISYLCAPRRVLSFRKSDPRLRARMLSFNKWLSLYYLLNLVGGRLDLFFVGGLADANALGMYSAASKIASVVVIVTNSYLLVLLPELSSALTPDAIRKKQRHSILIVALFALGIILLGVTADIAVEIVFGPKFAGTGAMIRIMCVGLLCIVAGYPLNATLFAWGRSEVFPIISGAGIAALIAGNAFFVPRMGASGAALAFSLSGIVGILTSCVLYFFHLNKRARESADVTI